MVSNFGTTYQRASRYVVPVLSCAGLFWVGQLCHSAEAAEVTGTVRLKGEIPPPEEVRIEPKSGVHSTEGCGSLEKASQKLLVDPSGGVRNAVVWLELPGSGQTQEREAPALLDQRECTFLPHVVTVKAGGELAIRNSDPVLHNLRIFAEGKPAMLMHRWQKVDAPEVRWPFAEPGRYVVRCGVHPWMYAWAVVLPAGRSAVTGPDGRFSLAGVPDGRHELRVWHETLGEQRVAVEVKGGAVELDPVLFEQAGGE